MTNTKEVRYIYIEIPYIIYIMSKDTDGDGIRDLMEKSFNINLIVFIIIVLSIFILI